MKRKFEQMKMKGTMSLAKMKTISDKLYLKFKIPLTKLIKTIFGVEDWVAST